MRKIIGKLQLMRDKLRRKVGVFLFDRKNIVPFDSAVSHIVVIRSDAKLGDSFISSFFYREIKKLPSVKVTVVTTSDLKPLYKDVFGVDRTLTSKKRSSYSELGKLAIEIGEVDLLVHLTERLKLKDMYFIDKLKPKNMASLDDGVNYVNVKMKEDTKGLRFNQKYKYLLELLGVKDIDDSYIIPDTSGTSKLNNEGYILVNPYGSNKNKTISKDKLIDFLMFLSERYQDKRIFILSSPATKAEASDLVDILSCDNVFACTNVESIYDAIEIVRLAKLVVSVDTSIAHIADGLNKKLVAIYPKYKNDSFNEWLPRDLEEISLVYSHSESMDPDMNKFSNGEVSEEIDRLLNL